MKPRERLRMAQLLDHIQDPEHPMSGRFDDLSAQIAEMLGKDDDFPVVVSHVAAHALDYANEKTKELFGGVDKPILGKNPAEVAGQIATNYLRSADQLPTSSEFLIVGIYDHIRCQVAEAAIDLFAKSPVSVKKLSKRSAEIKPSAKPNERERALYLHRFFCEVRIGKSLPEPSELEPLHGELGLATESLDELQDRWRKLRQYYMDEGGQRSYIASRNLEMVEMKYGLTGKRPMTPKKILSAKEWNSTNRGGYINTPGQISQLISTTRKRLHELAGSELGEL